jgi:hypothetical protein
VLYERLLGPDWLRLAEPIRAFHTQAPLSVRGPIRVSNGRSGWSRALARLFRLPRANDSAVVHLVVTVAGQAEEWRRTFDGVSLDTRQFEAAPKELGEQFGFLEVRFRLEAAEGGLRYRQVAAAVRIGSMRVPLPAAIAPMVEAQEDPDGPRNIRVRVGVTVPAARPILTYDGVVSLEDGRV